jgi:hypothetical protein
MSNVPPEILAWRKHTGADQWDEMWDGVLHMVPCPNCDHQDLEGALETWLRTWWAARTGGKVYHDQPQRVLRRRPRRGRRDPKP